MANLISLMIQLLFTIPISSLSHVFQISHTPNMRYFQLPDRSMLDDTSGSLGLAGPADMPCALPPLSKWLALSPVLPVLGSPPLRAVFCLPGSSRQAVSCPLGCVHSPWICPSACGCWLTCRSPSLNCDSPCNASSDT